PRNVNRPTRTSTTSCAAPTISSTRPSDSVRIATRIDREMDQRYLIANWKMNLPPEGIEAYLKAVDVPSDDVRIIVAPPFLYLRQITSQTKLAVAAQNCSDQEKGAFTGEVAASMVRDCGASFVIIGHSERRTLYGETDAMVARKLAVAITAGLVPVLCIGENLQTRETGHVASFLASQIRACAEANL